MHKDTKDNAVGQATATVCKSSTESRMPSGPVEWQKFGREWAITGQYRDRPIYLAFTKGKVLGERGILHDFIPQEDFPRFIIRALNSHDALVAVLDCLQGYIEERRLIDHDPHMNRLLFDARAALKLAKGEA